MASPSLPCSSSSLPSLRSFRPCSLPPPLPPCFPLPSSSTAHRPSLLLSAAAASRNSTPSASMSEEMRNRILESYGLDPSEFVSKPSESSTKKRRKGRDMDGDQVGGAGRRLKVPLEEPTSPARTTHKLLQVLGGKARRKKLLSPKGMDVRPMMEVVKGAAFDILQAAGGCPASLRPGRWLDLYSGTGSVGIEAISRGCSEVHFVEMDPWVISEVLRPNLEWTGFLDVSVLHTIRVERFLDQSEQNQDNNLKFDYISVTPPYTAVDYNILMEQLSKSPLIGENCFIMVEYPLKTTMADSCGNLIKVADRRFGRTNLLIYGPKWAEKKRKPGKPQDRH